MTKISPGRPKRHLTDRTPGSALIAIIAAVFLFSLLAAALLPMVSSSSHQTAYGHLAEQAFLLAESGYRLVERNTHAGNYGSLDDFDGATFTLQDHPGRFETRAFSYFFVVTDVPDTSQFQGNPPGSLPAYFEDLAIEDHLNHVFTVGGFQKVRVDTYVYTKTPGAGRYYPEGTPYIDHLVVTGGTHNDGIATLNFQSPGFLDQTQSSIADADSDPDMGWLSLVFPETTMERYNTEENTISYTENQGFLFPRRNGRILIDGYPNPLTYRYNNREANQFVALGDSKNPGLPQTLLPNLIGAPVVLTNDARIHVTGIIGSGDSEFRREVIYYNALRLFSDPVHEFMDDFANGQLANWEITHADVAIEEVEGNQALKITDDGVETSSLAALSPVVTEQRMTRYHRNSGGYLSYDTQAKVGTETDPDHIAAGLSFRLNSVASETEFNGYGLSFIRITEDLLDNTEGKTLLKSIVPPGEFDQLLIVLWQQTYPNRTWLAYKTINESLFPGYAALVVRLQEGALLSFNAGGPEAIHRGDWVYGETSGAMGTVVATPLVGAGAWSESDAQGILLLNKLTPDRIFSPDETLSVLNRTGSSATVSAYNDAEDRKVNLIRCYYASDTNYTRREPGERLLWPIESHLSTDTTFTLIEWDHLNDGVAGFEAVPYIAEGNGPIPRNVAVRSVHPQLQSPPLGSVIVGPELGLHAYGDPGANIYFDDFGFRLVFPLREQYATPLQQ